MDCKLRLEIPGAASHDVLVDVDDKRAVGDLVTALAEHVETQQPPQSLGLFCRRLGAWLPAERVVGEVGLRQGDQIVLAPHGAPVGGPDGAAVVDLLVMSGPCAGYRFPLAAGEHQVGRSSECTVPVADPAMSRVHLLVSVNQKGAVAIEDARSSNGTWMEGVRVSGPISLPFGQILELGESLISFAPATDVAAATNRSATTDESGRVTFNRPPRQALGVPNLKFELNPPPDRRGRQAAFSLTAAVLPLGMGFMMYKVSGGQPYMLLMALLSPLMVVGTFLEGAFGGSRQTHREAESYQEMLHGVYRGIAISYHQHEQYRRLISPDLATLVIRAKTADPKLWERRPTDPDFMLLRVGWGDVPSGITVEMQSGGDPAGRAHVQDLLERYHLMHDVPIDVPLKERGSVGLAGERQHVLGLARSLVMQTAALHSPRELMVVAALGGDLESWRFAKWLPQAHPLDPPLAGNPIVDTAIGGRDLVGRLNALVQARTQQTGGGMASNPVTSPGVLAVLDERANLSMPEVASLLTMGPRAGVYTIWLGSSTTGIPGECGSVVELDLKTGVPRLTLAGQPTPVEGFGADEASVQEAEDLAMALAPIRDVEAGSQAADIPSYVSLLNLLQLQEDEVSRIVDRWRHEDGRLNGLIGVGPGGEAFGVSLRSDGPHGLAGGMTGAGKSEMLQTLVAGLAAAHSPERLTFILVDYKGGAAFKDCIQLPHTVGLVTDLDGHLVTRCLTSLHAELKHREEVLSQNGYKDLPDFEEADIAHAFPSLFIVVDEFGALAGELPEFVDGMVDIAQRGRSLGIHLLLATQRPAGVISDRIRVNTPLRLSLRFADASDSQDVIGTKDAARPGLPRGRAFARTAQGGYYEFQAAHASGHTPIGGGPLPIRVHDLDVNGNVIEEAHGGGGGHHDAGAPTDLQRVVQAAQEAAQQLQLPAPRKPWLQQLPDVLPLESLDAQLPDDWRTRPVLPLGILDDPARQSQYLASFDIEKDGNLAIYGRSGAGKTALLRSLAVSVARSHTPDAIQIYGMDFATRGLRPLLALPHCGDVVTADEPERGQRLLYMLTAEMGRRRQQFGQYSATTLTEYRQAGGTGIPYILVLLDSYGNFNQTYENVDLGAPIDQFRALLTDGQALGIGFAITANRANAISTGMVSSISRKIVMRMANDDEYMFVGLERSVYQGATLPPGRGFLDQGMEVQTPLVGSDPAGNAQVEYIEALGKQLKERFPDARVPKVQLLPTDLSRSTLPRPTGALAPVIGLKDPDLTPAVVDLSEGHLLVAGPRRSGRSTALATFAASMTAAPDARPLFLLSPSRRSPLPHLDLWTAKAVGTDDCVALAQKLVACLDGTGTDYDLSKGAFVLLDDGEEMVDMSVGADLETLAKKGRDQNVRIIGVVESSAAQRAFGGWLAEVQRDRQGILLNPDPTADGGLVGVARLPARRGTMPPGRGYLAMAGIVTTIQVAGD